MNITDEDRRAALAFLTSADWMGAFNHGAEIAATAAALRALAGETE